MRKKRLITSVVFLLLGLRGLHAQDAIPATGGEATGSGGSSSYSVGQVVYTTNTGTTGSVAQGVQQPYEIFTTTGIEEQHINLELSVYPNPTTNALQLKVEGDKVESLTFQLLDMQGKLIESNKLISSSTTINMESLPTSTYFLKVTDEQELIKTFKIIKN